jgi:hypothetical protein
MAMSRDNTVLVLATTLGVTSQAAGVKLNGDINILTITQAADASVLPAGLPKGTITYIVNLSASASVLFPPVGGAINGGTVDASVALTASKTTIAIAVDGLGNFRTAVSA